MARRASEAITHFDKLGRQSVALADDAALPQRCPSALPTVLDTCDINDIVFDDVPQNIRWHGNQFTTAIIRWAAAVWKIDQAVAGVDQPLSEMVSSVGIELAQIIADRIDRDQRFK